MQYKRFHSTKPTSLIGYIKLLKINCKSIIIVFFFFMVVFFMLEEIQVMFIKKAERLAVERSEAYLDKSYRVVWNGEVIEQFENNLGLTKSVQNIQKCPYDRHILSILTFPEQTIDNYIWAYFSLYSLSSQKMFLQPVITQMLRKQLINIFDEVEMPVINNVPRNCFDLKNAIILGYLQEVLDVQPVATPYLLEEHGKRWRDVLRMNNIELKNKFRLKKELLQEVHQELIVSQSFVNLYNETSTISFIGVYIENGDRPTIDYYKRSMTFMRIHHTNPIFLVICDPESIVDYENIFYSNSSDVRVLRRADQYFTFALMASCNHTIISNEVGVLHAIYNGGESTVFEPEKEDDKVFYIPLLMAQELPNWYPIA